MSKDFFRGLAVILAVLLSGAGLSLVVSAPPTLAHFALMSAAPLAAAIFVPQKHRLRVIAYVFLFGGVYGLGRIFAEVERGMLGEGPPYDLSGRNAFELLTYVTFGVIWMVWAWLERKRLGEEARPFSGGQVQNSVEFLLGGGIYAARMTTSA